MVRIADISPGSIADELELRIGTRVIAINGAPVRDGLDFTFLSADETLELEAVDPDGNAVVVQIDRDPSEFLGLIPAPDKIRECANECVFCFIDGNPPDAREPLWLRDDDFRLSFTYGSYVTLTNLGPRGIERLVEQRISPLYVSVHATDPETRVRLLKNRRAGLIMDQLRFLLDGGLQVHAQVVVCPEWNDGEELDRTMKDLLGLGAGILSLSIVPVGLTRYNLGRPVRLLNQAEAGTVIDQCDATRAVALAERGSGWCYAADELFLIAGRSVPSAEYYDDWQLTENGVGAVRSLMDDIDRGVPDLTTLEGTHSIRLVTGKSMAPLFTTRQAALSKAMGCPLDIVAVDNDYFGPSVTIAGLLAGRDIVAALGGGREGDVVLLPAEALNADDVFIDGMSLDELQRALAPSQVLHGHELVETLQRL